MAKAIPVNMKANTKDFHRIEERIQQVLKEANATYDTPEEKTEAEKRFASTLGHYTGPAIGLVWDEASGKISIAPGFHADADGNVVKD